MLPRLRRRNIEDFLLFVDIIFESSDICAPFGILIEDGELVMEQVQGREDRE